jgi:trigger factor
MRYTIERLPESRVAIEVELEPEVVEKALDRASQRLSRRYPIPGFRPGKAPRRVIEAMLGRDTLYEEAVDELVDRVYQEILMQSDFEPIASATLERISYQPFSFRLVVPVVPTVVLGDYRSLRFPLEPEPVTEEQVDARIEELRRAQLVWREPDPPRPAARGDRVLISGVIRYEEGNQAPLEEMEVVLEGEGFLPGLTQGLIGAQVGEVRELDVAFPDDLTNERLAGKRVHLTLIVRSIKAPELPPLDDDWARSLGQGETLAELRARLRRELEAEALAEAREKVFERMLQAIEEQSTVDLPQVLVDQEIDWMIGRVREGLQARGTSLQRYLEWRGITEDQLREEYRELARKQVRRALVLPPLTLAEGLEVTPEELEEELSREEADTADATEREADAHTRVLFAKLRERLLAIALGQVPESA